MKILRLFLVILLPTIAAAGLRASFELSLFQTGCDSAAAVRVETSYLIDRSDLSFVQTDSGRFGVYRAWMEVFQSDSLVFSSGWERFDHLGIGEDVTYTQKIPDLEATCLGAGEYRVRATVQDQNSGKSTQAEWVVTIPSLVTDTPCVSDPVMMARPPEAVSGNPFFERFGLLVVPYADAIFGDELP
ncbi:hypothetical protein H8D51_03400, partial [bacterium]|nr:hypothetical protein [bacterium]